jgi:hypothetical protein
MIMGCNPDRFTLNFKADRIIFGKILDSLNTFEQINDNSFRLESGRIALKIPQVTQSIIEYNYKIINGDTLDFVFRAVEHLFDESKGILIKLHQNGTTIYENGNKIDEMQNPKFVIGEKNYVKIRNIGDILKFSHNCDSINIKTSIPSTEQMLIIAHSKTKIQISGLKVEKIIDTPIEKISQF